MARRTLWLPLTAVLLSLGSTAASGDPIRFTYDIHVTQRCTSEECTALSVRFPLTLSFEPGITYSVWEPELRTQYYGAANFSEVPLDRPEIFGGASGFASTADIAVLVPPFEWRHVAEAQVGAQLITPEYDYRWYLGLYEVQDYFMSAPELSPTSFGAFLGSGRNQTAFGYSFSGRSLREPGVLSPESIGYSGTAMLRDEPAPVPEPATIGLLSLGIGILAARAKRRRQPVRF